MLLYSAPVATGWNSFFGNLRQNLELDGKLKELAICYVGLLNGANYEFDQHLPVYEKLGGNLNYLDLCKKD
jgi:alkylhydroperoxidase family enzyme